MPEPPLPLRALITRQASSLPQFDMKTLEPGRSGVFFIGPLRWAQQQQGVCGRWLNEHPCLPHDQDNDRVIETDIPARLDSLRWSGFHTRVVLALGITWILDGLEVTLAGALSGALKESPTLQFTQFRCRPRQQRLSRRRRDRRARLRLADRPDRPQETVLHHAGALSHRDRGDRVVVECRELRAVSVSDRRRHRRRIHRDQFDDPGTGAGALSRLDRSRHQRQLLDRRGDGRGRRHRAARSGHDRPRSSAGGWPISSAPCSA